MMKNHNFDAVAFLEESIIFWTAYGVIEGGFSIEQSYRDACDFIKGIHEVRGLCPLTASFRAKVEAEVRKSCVKKAV